MAFRCFPEDSTVTLESGEKRLLGDLRVGDRILTVNNAGILKYTPVILFLDRLPRAQGHFLRIRVQDGSHLTISPYHLIYRISNHHFNSNSSISEWRSWTRPVFAKDLEPGMLVLVQRDNSVTVQNVTEILSVESRGAYAPLTAEGTILVDGVLSSCYAATEYEALAHAALIPARIWSWLKQFLPANSYRAIPETEGIHWYADALLSISKWTEHWLLWRIVV